MKNTLKFITEKELKTISTEDVFTAVIDGKKIRSWADYWNEVAVAFSFPDLPEYMKPDYHSYYDLMTDLSWLESENIVLIIENAEDFLKDDLKLKNDIIRDFREYLLPFWADDVTRTVVDGKIKNFSVYFVGKE